MEVELIEIRDFLAEHLPFSLLERDALNTLPPLLSVRYLRRGSTFPPAHEKQACLYLICQGAVERRTADGALVDKLGEGDAFDGDCLTATERMSGTAIEDTLLYLLPCTTLQALRRQYPVLDAYFVSSVAERMRHNRRDVIGDTRERASLMNMAVSALVRRAPVSAAPSLAIGDAARLMSKEAVSALLVVDAGRLCGILTDRDLRTRCLARGLSPNTPLATIMSRAVISIGPENAVFEALMQMARHGIHHLPVVDAAGVCGLVSSTDLMHWQSANAVYLAGLIRKAQGLDELIRVSAELPELQLQMHAGSATPDQVGQAISSVNDAITSRLIELAQREIGPAPVVFAWLACGSQGRHEQTVHSDQDNALIFDDAFDSERHGAYFAELAARVNDGLNACGHLYCPGKVMASNPAWRLPQRDWITTFRGWMMHTDSMAAMLAANFLDLRAVFGAPALLIPLHDAIKETCSKHEVFLARMVANALDNRPPLGFFRNFTLIANGDHADTLDIKRGGLIPISDIARIHALATGRTEIGTVARLRACAGTPVLSTESARELEEAFEYFGSLRLRHQAKQIRRGIAPDNYLSPKILTALERKYLKEGFAVVDRLQKVLAQRYRTRLHE